VIGTNVALVPSLRYYYRLHCGGDMRRGHFETTSAKSSTRAVKISQGTTGTLTWGYTYSRDTGTISGGSTASVTAGTPFTITADRGKIIYWRVGASGRVQTTAVQ
jgi:hypothetical protein